MSQGTIVVITGKSASGKTELMNGLLKAINNTGTIQSVTTRLPRPDDSSDDYEFISFEEFQCDLKDEKFVSWRKRSKDPIRKDDFYSVRVSEIDRALQSDSIFVRSLTPDTIKLWHNVAKNKIVFIHLLAPDKKEAYRRMREREGMSEDDIRERFEEEGGWDEEIHALIAEGIPINIIPQLALENVLEKALEIIFA